MRVKELTLQGFKSFAGKHRFVFPPGITAIVGPNGSGKSNIADAVRWVLGEQRSTALRAKRTDEIIFAGTERRPRAGLAEVSLTLDNDERWLDVDFREVVLSRRAHRDGVNAYLVNAAQVRLRDVVDLVGSHLGHGGYTVIGQGMVDSALSLRPDERRVLIDEAAGLVPLQRRRDRALQRLADTNDNLTRVNDIVEELGPRMRRMARLAERAARHDEVATQLRELLRAWYGHHWFRAQSDLERERQLVAELREEVSAARQRGDQAAEGTREADAARIDAQARLSEARRQREQRSADLVAARQAAAVGRARLDGLAVRAAELASGRESDDEMLAAQRERAAQLEAEVAEIRETAAEFARSLERRQADLAAAEEAHELQGRAAEAARASLLGIDGALEAARERLAAAETERVALEQRGGSAREQVTAAEEEVQGLVAAATAAEESAAAAASQLAAAAEAVEAVENELSETDRALADARERHAAAAARLGSLQARAQALDALFAEVAEGTDALEAVRRVPGIEVVGRVAELIEVEDGWEAAVAAALASHVQGIVLRGSGLERVVATLEPEGRGSLTLVPLSAEPDHKPWSSSDAERRAGDVAGSRRADGLVDALLGGTAFVESLDDARRALSRPDGPSQVATRDGRLFLPRGVVVLGAPGRETLALEAERRALPADIQAAAGEAAAIAAEIDRLSADRRGHEGRLSESTRARRERDRAHVEAAEAAEKARSRADRASRERDWLTEALDRLQASIAALEQSAAGSAADIERLESERTEASHALSEAEATLDTTSVAAARAAVMTATAQASEAGQALAGRGAMLEAARADLEASERRLAAEMQRASALAREREALATELDGLQETVSALAAEMERSDAAVVEAETALRDLERAAAETSAGVDAAARQLAALENRLGEARVAEAHAEERVHRLGEQLLADADVIAPEVGEAEPDEGWPVEALGSLLEPADSVAPDLERRIAELRRDLRAIGAIDREALAAYQDTRERYDHLTTEREDLEAAQRDTLSAIERLEAEMDERFERTFAAVADAFQAFFPQLFGGGEAELVLQREDRAVGIDILARPPGKRRQPLSLLSGGERSLTAVALVFALLRVSRTPFVVLDEVDAALDEANVARFRTALELLAETTQVVIVTHNRGTIQAADTVYGITMAEDGASQVMSLQVPRDA